MKAFLQALYTKVTATTGGNHNAFYNSVEGKFYFTVAPQNISTPDDALTHMPYCVYHLINDQYDYQFREEFQNILLQFNLYSSSRSAVEITDIYANLISLLDWCNMTVTGYRLVKFEREFDHLVWLEDFPCWQYSIQYRVLLEKS